MRSFLPWRRRSAVSPPGATGVAASNPSSGPSARDLARAARILEVRSRREAAGIFAGSYTSAFRGGGIEFDESRPYVPGDDIRNLDWNALARTGEPFVKHFREERDETVLIALDVSASMQFGTTGRSKAATAAHAVALIAAAAGGAGDRVGLLCFDETVRAEVRPGRGPAQTRKVIETAVTAARTTSGGTELGPVIDRLLSQSRQRSVAMVLSDFRRPSARTLAGDATDDATRARLVHLSQLNDLVCVVLHDPREESLPRAGLVRVEDPEAPGRTLLLNSNSATTRARFRRAWAARAAHLERTLRASGGGVVWMRTDRDPLRTLMHYFTDRSANARSAA